MTQSFDQKAHAEPAAIAAPHQQRLPSGLREESTAHFGAQFDDIDISPTAVAPAMTANGAGAVTVGDAIAFGDTTYQSDSGWGRELIAHELAQVVQQRSSTGRPSHPGRLACGPATVGFRPKLKVDQPGDVYEQEADEIAERVMRSPAGDASGSRGNECCSGCASGTGCSGGVQRQAASAGSRAHGSEVSSDTESRIRSRGSAGQLSLGKPSDAAERAADAAGQHPLVHPTTRTVDAIDASAPARNSASLTSAALFHEAVASPGEPLDEDTRALMEPSFHHNFSNVRVHADMSSSQSAGRVNALAYTAGRDIVFAAGSYAPGTDSGRRLLAHELAHVVQQSSGPVDGSLVTGGIKLSDPADRFEQEAELTAERVIAGRPVSIWTGGKASASPSAGPVLSVQRSNGSTPITDSPTRQQMIRDLLEEHAGLNPKVAGDAVEGAVRVMGKGGKGGDVVLDPLVTREVSVHTGRFDAKGIIAHLQGEARQAGVREIYLQVDTGGLNRQAVREVMNSIQNGIPELNGVRVRIYNADGQVMWQGNMRFRDTNPIASRPAGGNGPAAAGPEGGVPGGAGKIGETPSATEAGEVPMVEAGGSSEALAEHAVAGGGALAVGEVASMLSFAINWLVLPLALDFLQSWEDKEAAEAERAQIQEALIKSWPMIMTNVLQRQAELAYVTQHAKEGQTVYANVNLIIEPAEYGAGRGSYDPEPEKPEMHLSLVGVSLSTAKLQSRSGTELVVSIPLYKQEVDPSRAASSTVTI